MGLATTKLTDRVQQISGTECGEDLLNCFVRQTFHGSRDLNDFVVLIRCMQSAGNVVGLALAWSKENASNLEVAFEVEVL